MAIGESGDDAGIRNRLIGEGQFNAMGFVFLGFVRIIVDLAGQRKRRGAPFISHGKGIVFPVGSPKEV